MLITFKSMLSLKETSVKIIKGTKIPGCRDMENVIEMKL